MKKNNRFISWIKSSSSDVWLFIIALVLLNLVASRCFFRADLTEPKSYSLSSASREVVRNLEEPMSVKVFFSKNLPAPYSNVEQYLKDLLAEYKNASGKNFDYEFFDMNKQENQRIARGYGMQMVQVREVKNNEVGLKNAYMGIAIVYADQIEKLDGISSSDGLEYKITGLIGKIIASTNILSGLSENVRLVLYKSEALAKFNIGNFDAIDSAVSNAFSAANKKFRGRIEYQKINPDAATTDEAAERYGLQAVTWNNPDGTTGKGTVGLVLEYGDKFRIVPLRLTNAIFSYVISGLENLDESISQSVESLVSKTSVVAYITGHGERNIEDENDAMYFRRMLSDTYSLESVNLIEDDIPVAAETVIINGPKSAFDEKELYKIDQFIMRGGNVMFFIDSYDEQISGYQQPSYVPVRTGLEKLLSKYGVEVGSEYVLDEKCFVRMDQQYGKMNFYHVPRIQKNCLDQKNPIGRNLGDVFFLESFALDSSNAKENKSVDVTVLAKSSSRSWTVPVTEGFMLSPFAFAVPSDDAKLGSRDLCVLLEGNFDSAYASAPSEEENREGALSSVSHILNGKQKSKIFVAGTSFITTAQLIQPDAREPIVYFMRNAVDYMCGKEDLCLMRTKDLSTNMLKETKNGLAVAMKYFNQFGLAVLVAIAGLIVLAVRKNHRERIRRTYNPNDPRMGE
ncbi:GldG family protein [Treponema sp.]|uniref:GldG family protein n=1 Tax=Treponema sp. TaxID=166 RepID=UPI00388E917A